MSAQINTESALSRYLPPEDSEDPNPWFASPKQPTTKSDIQNALTEFAAKAGGELYVEERHRAVGPMPIRTAGDSFVNRTCPRCRGDQFWHEYGDEYCRCASCGAELDIEQLVV